MPHLHKTLLVVRNIQMTTIRLLSFIILLQAQNCYSQSNNPDTLFNKFRNDIQIEQREHSGVVGMDDETKISYYSFVSNCSFKDLIKYSNDSNAFIRSYVFAGLLRKEANKDELLRILEIHKNDTAKFTCIGADVVTEWTVKEFMEAGMRLKATNELPNIDYKKAIEKLKSPFELKLKISGISHGLIGKQQLLNIDSLNLTQENFQVVSFTLFVAGQEMKSSSFRLTNDMKYAIEKTKPGEYLVFDNIKVVGRENIVRQIVSMTLKVK